MRSAVVAMTLLFLGVIALPSAAADDGGTPADALILSARNEVDALTPLLSGTTGPTPGLRARTTAASVALAGARTVTARYPCPADAQACRDALVAAHDLTGSVISDVNAIAGVGAEVDPSSWDTLVARYTTDAAAFHAAWDEFRAAYREAHSAGSGLSATTTWLLVAGAVVVSLALTTALGLWARGARPPGDDRLVTARRALVTASALLSCVVVGATVTILVVDGFDASPSGRAGGKAALVVLLVPVAVLNLIWATVRYARARKKFGATRFA